MQQSIISNNNNNNAYYYKSSTNEMDDGKSIQCKTQNLSNLILADDKKRSVKDDNSTKKVKVIREQSFHSLLIILTSTLITGLPALLFSVMEFQMLLTLLNGKCCNL
uniref:Uncharacterized protein n=1 Tax=Romanomermis culicivorax TaxID=13658 RepID=A0A915JUF7_ROMCU